MPFSFTERAGAEQGWSKESRGGTKRVGGALKRFTIPTDFCFSPSSGGKKTRQTKQLRATESS